MVHYLYLSTLSEHRILVNELISYIQTVKHEEYVYLHFAYIYTMHVFAGRGLQNYLSLAGGKHSAQVACIRPHQA